MIFYQKRKPPRVWLGKDKSMAVTFHDGKFKTDDPEIIKALISAGFPHEKETEDLLTDHIDHIPVLEEELEDEDDLVEEDE